MSGHAAPLAGLRVLEIGAPAAVTGGRTLAKLGAEVIRIDPAGSAGDPARRPTPLDMSPAWTGQPRADRPVALDSRPAPGRQTLAELLAASGPRGGIVLTSTAGRAWASHAELARSRPDVIHLQAGYHPMCTAGRNGPAAAGPCPGTGPERSSGGRNHLLPAWDAAYGLHAVAGLLAACQHRQHTGQGRAIKLTPEGVARALPGHLGRLAQAQLTRVHQVRIGDAGYGGFASDSGGVAESRALKAEQPADVTADHGPAIGGEAVALHVLIDLQDIGDQGRARVVAQLRPGAVEAAADMGAYQTDGAPLAGADGGEPAAEEHALAHLQPVSDQGRARVVAQVRPVAQEAAADVGAGQADRAVLAAAGGGEPFAEEYVLADLQAVGEKGGAAVVMQARPVTVEAPADVGTHKVDRTTAQADRAVAGAAGDRCSAEGEHAAGEPVGGQRRLGGVFEPASGQADESQAGTPGKDALLQKAILQLKADIRGEVLQIKPAGDPSPPKPQTARVRVGRQPPPQDVADHRRMAGPGLPPVRIAASSTASSLAARSSQSPRPTCSTSDRSTAVNPPADTRVATKEL